MTADKPFEIQIDKYKMALPLFTFGLFFALGLWLLGKPPMGLDPGETIYGNRNYDLIMGIAVCLFFGVAFVFALKMFFDKRPALLLSAEGITYNASFYKSLFIPWSQISSVGEARILFKKYLVLNLYDADGFVRDQSGAFFRFLLMSVKRTGRIRLEQRLLLCDYQDLKQLLEVKLENYRSKTM